MAQLIGKNYEDEVRVLGLQDGGHNILKCSMCSKPVLDIWVVKPNMNFEANYKATCPYCNNTSYTKKVKGQITVGGIPDDGDYDSDTSKPLTFVESFNTIEENGEAVILFKIGKY